MTAQLKPFATNIWVVEGPIVSFHGFPYPTRSVIIHLESSGASWIWSPTAFSEVLAQEIVETAGPVEFILSPNKIHWLFMKPWKDYFPNAKLFASPGLADRKIAQDLSFDATLCDDETHHHGYASEIDQIVFKGGILDEVVFFHKQTKTVIFCDLIQRHDEKDQTGFKGWLMKLNGLVGLEGSTPKEWKLSFKLSGSIPLAKKSLAKVLEVWQPDKMIIAHGENATENATIIIAKSLSWIEKG